MKLSINISFEHDNDSNLYMISSDPDGNSWKVIVHCRDGRKYSPSVEKFFAYPGCKTHEGSATWMVDYFSPEKIEIQLPNNMKVIIEHPCS